MALLVDEPAYMDDALDLDDEGERFEDRVVQNLVTDIRDFLSFSTVEELKRIVREEIA